MKKFVLEAALALAITPVQADSNPVTRQDFTDKTPHASFAVAGFMDQYVERCNPPKGEAISKQIIAEQLPEACEGIHKLEYHGHGAARQGGSMGGWSLRRIAGLALLASLVPLRAAAEIPDDVAETYDLGFKLVTQDERFSMRIWGADPVVT